MLRSMNAHDRSILDALHPAARVDDAVWALVEKAVEDAGDIRDVDGAARTILDDAADALRKGSRSEAARHAANVRWGNAGGGGAGKGPKGGGKPGQSGGSARAGGVNWGPKGDYWISPSGKVTSKPKPKKETGGPGWSSARRKIKMTPEQRKKWEASMARAQRETDAKFREANPLTDWKRQKP